MTGGCIMSIHWGAFIAQLIIIPIFLIAVYIIVLLIKVARRGIIALDIYIEKYEKKE